MNNVGSMFQLPTTETANCLLNDGVACGPGCTLQVLAVSAALRQLWAFRFHP